MKVKKKIRFIYNFEKKASISLEKLLLFILIKFPEAFKFLQEKKKNSIKHKSINKNEHDV